LHRDEHSLEMQMPFLQQVMPGLRIVPVLMGTQSCEEVDALVAALARALAEREVLLVASSAPFALPACPGRELPRAHLREGRAAGRHVEADGGRAARLHGDRVRRKRLTPAPPQALPGL
jgi:hypothetical protein